MSLSDPSSNSLMIIALETIKKLRGIDTPDVLESMDW